MEKRQDGFDPVDSRSFEENMAKLEKLVSQLERGELSLEEALKCYEEGVALVDYCHKTLDRAANAIEVLTDKLSRPE